MNKEKERIEVWHEQKLPLLLQKFPTRIQDILKSQRYLNSNGLSTSMYMFGRVRTGKSVTAAKKALEWSLKRFTERHLSDFIFITAPELLAEIKACYNGDNGKSEWQVIEKFKKVPLLVLDDLGVTKTNEWNYQMMYMILTYRYDEKMITIYTSNLSLQELADKLQDDRLTSRIAHDCGPNIFEFDNEPYI